MTHRRYRLDYDWLWTDPPHNDGTPATVRLVVADGKRIKAAAAVEAWLASLPKLGENTYGRGGWTVRLVRTPSEEEKSDGVTEKRPGDNCADRVCLDLSSGGEDVLDGIEAATAEAYEQVIRNTDLSVSWEQLPTR